MSEENLNNQQGQTDAYYYDPLTAQTGKPVKNKAGGGLTIAATAVSAIVFFLFGPIGGLICYGGYWAVLGIAKSKLPTTAKVILGVVVGLAFVILLFAFILFAAALRESL